MVRLVDDMLSGWVNMDKPTLKWNDVFSHWVWDDSERLCSGGRQAHHLISHPG